MCWEEWSTHLTSFFTDGLFLFVEANIDLAGKIKDALNTFGAASGRKVNELKTIVFFSNNTKSNYANAICRVLCFRQTDDLGIYLGLPLVHRREMKNTFKFVVDKVR